MTPLTETRSRPLSDGLDPERAVAAPAGGSPEPPRADRAPRHRWAPGLGAGVVLLLGVLVVVAFTSIALGSRSITPSDIWNAFTAFDAGNAEHIVLRDLRVPRTLLGLLAGAALGLAGAILQGLTRNPLGDPGIMGINGGAAAAMVGTIAIFGTQDLGSYIWASFVGAALAVVTVYGVASLGREGATPVKLALAGAAVSAGLYSLTTAIVSTDLAALNELRFWQVGSLAGRYLPVLEQTAPFLLVGLVLALCAGRALNGLALGDDVATALGQRVGLTRAVLLVVVVLLSGAATAACGPIVFVGLVIPHAARAICGPDYRWIMVYATLLSPIVLLLCDIAGRLALGDGELQVGVVLGVLGAPVFVALVRYKNLAEL